MFRLRWISSIFSTLAILIFVGIKPVFCQNTNTAGIGNGGTKGVAGKQTWSKDPFDVKAFIENKGQFDNKDSIQGSQIKYAIFNKGTQFYFTSGGWTYRHDETRELTEEEIKKEAKSNEVSGAAFQDREHAEAKTISYFVRMNWAGASPDVQIVASDPVTNYFTYPDMSDKSGKSGIKAFGYTKITYQNLYPGIDVEYTFPENKPGIKYSLILHPGADVSSIKMLYSQISKIYMDGEGNIQIETPFGNFVDHAPSTNFKNGTPIKSAFELSGQTVSFKLSNARKAMHNQQTIIIDPWTTNPASGLYTWNAVYDINYDLAGNVYVYGGGYPWNEIKFNSAGVMQWWFSTNGIFYATGCAPMGFGACYGDFAVDGSSESSYIVEAFDAGAGVHVLKLNSAGIETGLYTPPNNNLSEMWRVQFNNCTKQAIIAGGGISQTYQACLLDTNVTTMTPVNVLNASSPYHDFALLGIDNYGNCFMATVEKVTEPGVLNNILLECPSSTLLPVTYMVSDNHTFEEVASVSYVEGVTSQANGFNGIAVDNNYVYTYDGTTLKKWFKNTGTFYKSKTLPGTTFASGGLDVSPCGDLFAGVGSSIYQLDSNFNTITTYPTSGTVYDLKLGPGNIMYAAGAAFVSAIALTSTTCGSLNASVVFTPDSCGSTGKGTATVTASGGVGPYTYLWSPSGQTTQTATGLSSSTYTVTVNDVAYTPCSSLGGGVQTLTVTVPNTGFTASASPNASICPGDTVQLSSSPSGDTYSWIPSTGLSSTTASNPKANPTVTTTYTVTVTTPTGCTSTATATITVYAVPPAPTITTSANGDTLFCSYNGVYTSYQWYRNDTLISGATNSYYYIGTDSSTFKVSVANTNGCTNSSSSFSDRSLPIELLSFDAAYNPARAWMDLYWSTASEINNDFFTVERTKDGIDFTPIVNVKGAGNSTTLLYYHTVDDNPLPGVSVYRLKQTDFDGKYQYSGMVAVTIQPKGKLAILALNASVDNNSVQYFISTNSGKPLNIEISDRIGKVIVSKTSNENIGTIDFSGFSHGIYLFRIYDSTGYATRKFVY